MRLQWTADWLMCHIASCKYSFLRLLEIHRAGSGEAFLSAKSGNIAGVPCLPSNAKEEEAYCRNDAVYTKRNACKKRHMSAGRKVYCKDLACDQDGRTYEHRP